MAQLKETQINNKLTLLNTSGSTSNLKLFFKNLGTSAQIGMTNSGGTSKVGVTLDMNGAKSTSAGRADTAGIADQLKNTITFKVGNQTLTTNGTTTNLTFTAANTGFFTSTEHDSFLRTSFVPLQNDVSDYYNEFQGYRRSTDGSLSEHANLIKSNKNIFDDFRTQLQANKFLIDSRVDNKNKKSIYGYIITTPAASIKKRVWSFYITDVKGKKDKLKCYHETKKHYEGGKGVDWVTGTSICTAQSDIRLKTNIKDSTLSGLDLINKIQLRSFDWINEGVHQPIGFIADELEKLDPMLANGGGYDDEGNMDVKSVETFYLQGYEIKAIQELDMENKQLKSQIAKLTARIEQLEQNK